MSGEGRRAQFQVAIEKSLGVGAGAGRETAARFSCGALDWMEDGDGMGVLGRDSGQEKVGCKWAIGRLHCPLSGSLSAPLS